MRLLKSASKTPEEMHRVITHCVQVRVLDVLASSESEAIHYALERDPHSFRNVHQYMEIVGVRVLDDDTPVHYFDKPLFHSPCHHEECQ